MNCFHKKIHFYFKKLINQLDCIIFFNKTTFNLKKFLPNSLYDIYKCKYEFHIVCIQ